MLLLYNRFHLRVSKVMNHTNTLTVNIAEEDCFRNHHHFSTGNDWISVPLWCKSKFVSFVHLFLDGVESLPFRNINFQLFDFEILDFSYFFLNCYFTFSKLTSFQHFPRTFYHRMVLEFSISLQFFTKMVSFSERIGKTWNCAKELFTNLVELLIRIYARIQSNQTFFWLSLLITVFSNRNRFSS